MFCSKCGKENANDVKFCSHCGAAVQLTATPTSNMTSAGATDSMTFGKSISTCLSKFADFSGRATRPEYWWFYLFTLMITWAAMLIDTSDFLSSIISLVLLIPSIAAGTRRLHDTNRSGWWQLLYITIIGAIPVIIWLASEGSHEENEYGSSLY